MINHITLGTKEVFYFDYNGEQLPLRPISSYELDQCFYYSLIFADSEVSDFVIKLKLGIINPQAKIDIDNSKYAEIKKYFDSLDYWIVYYGMKDFQDFDFQKETNKIPNGIEIVKEMDFVHEISSEILSYSYQPKEVIKEIIKDEEGKLIATVVFNLNVPLSDFASMTKLQRDFLILSKIGNGRSSNISKTGDTIKIGDLLRGQI